MLYETNDHTRGGLILNFCRLPTVRLSQFKVLVVNLEEQDIFYMEPSIPSTQNHSMASPYSLIYQCHRSELFGEVHFLFCFLRFAPIVFVPFLVGLCQIIIFPTGIRPILLVSLIFLQYVFALFTI